MRYERVHFALPRWQRPRAGAVFRYDLIDRMRRCGRPHGVDLIAFGFETTGGLRCLLRGDPKATSRAVKGVKVGTALALRHTGWGGHLGVPDRRPLADERAIDAVVWAHRAPLGGRRSPRRPLATPWSSHRDLLGYREAVFFDAKPLRARFDPQVVHKACGGASPPSSLPTPVRWPLATLLRVAAAVIGVVPADRRCFALFVHLAHAAKWPNRDIAAALCLTPRRVRQLFAHPAAHLDLARQSLGDPRLQRVP